MNPYLQKLIETGIPVSQAKFHAAVNNANQTPENDFNVNSNSTERRVDMWYTSHGLVCHQKNVKKQDCYWIVPLPSIIFANFSKQIDLEELACNPNPHIAMIGVVDSDIVHQENAALYGVNTAIDIKPLVIPSGEKLVEGIKEAKKRGRPFKNPQ